jgi:hypothetical protein
MKPPSRPPPIRKSCARYDLKPGSAAAAGARGHLVVLARDEFLGRFHRHGGVPAIGVGADGRAEFLVQRRAAHQNDVVVADALFVQRVDHDLHVGHRRGQQRRHAEDVGLSLSSASR